MSSYVAAVRHQYDVKERLTIVLLANDGLNNEWKNGDVLVLHPTQPGEMEWGNSTNQDVPMVYPFSQ